MNYVDYLVVILNYNTAADALLAAESVNKTAGNKSFHIIIADNNSNKAHEKEILRNAKIKNSTIIELDKNYGYAVGNNMAVEYASKSYHSKYIVIMNPDVCIERPNTIDGLLGKLELCGNGIAGIQPLVHTVMWDEKPNMQINIRKVPQRISEILVYVNMFGRKFFAKTRKNINYENERPYINEIEYEVPSGAFFIIKAADFEAINGFDSSTFMYCEEIILGKKIKNLGKCFLLAPRFQVEHYHGKSTGSHNGVVSEFTKKELIKSWDYYIEKYTILSSNAKHLIEAAIVSDCFVRNTIRKIKK